MTILQALKNATKKAGINTELQFNDISTQIQFINSFKFDQYPLNIIVPYTTNGTDIGPRRKVILRLEGWVLTQIRGDHQNYRPVKLEEAYIAPMRKLAVKFLRNFYLSDFIDPEVQNITDTIQPVYNFTDQSLFGVSYVANVPIIEKVCLEANDYNSEEVCD